MSIKIEMPKLSDTMTEGTLLRWRKNVGDVVEIGDIIAEVETDKATMEMEAFDDGVLLEILVGEGQKAPVGSVIGILGSDNEKPETAASAQPAAVAAAPSSPAPAVATTPVAVAAPVAAPASVCCSSASGERIKSSPLARKIAAGSGVDLAQLQGSGPGGRIIARDVEAAASAPAKSCSAAPAQTAAASVAASAPVAVAAAAKAILPTVGSEDEVVALTSMRRIIAERLSTSKQTIPHFYLSVSVDVGQLMSLRAQINTQAAKTHGNKYSVNDFVMKAVVNAAQVVPSVNASFNGDSIVRFKNVGLSVAVAIADGLVTPVIKLAQNKSILQLSSEMKDMAARARDRKLRPDEFDGGTITISNLGAYGIEQFQAIVNPPQAAILAVGAIIEKPVVKHGAVVAAQIMQLTLSCDHRVVDGADGARFLAEVKNLLENPALVLV